MYITGLIELNSKEIIYIENTTINTESVINLLDKTVSKYCSNTDLYNNINNISNNTNNNITITHHKKINIIFNAILK